MTDGRSIVKTQDDDDDDDEAPNLALSPPSPSPSIPIPIALDLDDQHRLIHPTANIPPPISSKSSKSSRQTEYGFGFGIGRTKTIRPPSAESAGHPHLPRSYYLRRSDLTHPIPPLLSSILSFLRPLRLYSSYHHLHAYPFSLFLRRPNA